MKVNKVEIAKLIQMLQDIRERGHSYVSIEFTETPDNQMLSIHPIKDMPQGDIYSFNPDLID